MLESEFAAQRSISKIWRHRQLSEGFLVVAGLGA
jgi:hypothetical protein